MILLSYECWETLIECIWTFVSKYVILSSDAGCLTFVPVRAYEGWSWVAMRAQAWQTNPSFMLLFLLLMENGSLVAAPVCNWSASTRTYPRPNPFWNPRLVPSITSTPEPAHLNPSTPTIFWIFHSIWAIQCGQKVCFETASSVGWWDCISLLS